MHSLFNESTEVQYPTRSLWAAKPAWPLISSWPYSLQGFQNSHSLLC